MASLKNWTIQSYGSSASASSNTIGIMTSDGRLIAWGSNTNLPLGGASGAQNPAYISISGNKTIKSASFCNNSIMVVCTDGTVQVCGTNSGQLGTGNSSHVSTFTEVALASGKLGKKVVNGDGRSFVLCTDGTVQMATGNGTFSALNVSSIVDISFDYGGLLCLGSNNSVYCFGDITGSFSAGWSNPAIKTVPAGNTISRVVSSGLYGRHHALCTNGKVFIMGNASASKGWPAADSDINYNSFVEMTRPSGKLIKDIGGGIVHTHVITTDNKVFATGMGGYNALGIAGASNQSNWTQVTSLKAGRTPIAVDGANQVSIIIYDDGSVQMCGMNLERQLGDGTTTSRELFTNIAQVSGATVYSTTDLGNGTAPGAPTGVTATGGNGQAVVSFTAPESDGGAAITSYTVTASPGGATASGASSPITVTGLTNGTSYTFTVTATNSVGTSSASSASSAVTPSISVSDLNSGNISSVTDTTIVSGSRTITAKKVAKSAGAVSYAPDAANKPSVAISNIPATVQDMTVGVAAADASGVALVKLVALDSNGNSITDFAANPLTVRVTLPGFTAQMVTIQTSTTIGGAVTDTITGYKVGTELYEFTTTHLTYFAASQYVPCFVAGTRILTAEGYKAVETLTPSDLIRTADNRVVPFRMYTTQIEATSPETAPYTIPANTFGRACPATDLTISPYHAIQSGPNTWQIPKYAAKMFRGITQAPAGRPITYYHLELPNYFKDNIVAEGTVVESYGNRQTAGMKTVYRLNAGRTGFTRLEKPKSAKKTA